MVVLAPAPQVAGGPPHHDSHPKPTEGRAAVSGSAGPRHAKLELPPRQSMQRAQQPGRRQRLGPPQRGRADTVPYREHAPGQQAQLLAARRSSNAAATSSGREQPPSQRSAQRTRQQRPVLQTAVSSNNPRDWKATRDWLVMELDDIRLDESVFQELIYSCDLEPHWRPQMALYYQLGLTADDLRKLAVSRRNLFMLSVPSVRAKLAFLRTELAMDDADIRRLLLKFPRIIEYKTERTLRPRINFLLQHGVPQSELSKVVLRAPAVLELSVEDTLLPRVAFLRDTVGVAEENLGKVILRLPSVLTYSEESMQQRIEFLLEAGLCQEDLAKAVTSHPQVLHYKVDSMQEKVAYLRSIGMSPSQVGVVLQRLPQLLSLDVRNNLVPKYRYLQAELGGDVDTVANYPAYFSLSLPLRIMPRHRYLQTVRSEPMRPFPMNYLKCSDVLFAANIANTPLDQFEAFKQQFAANRAMLC